MMTMLALCAAVDDNLMSTSTVTLIILIINNMLYIEIYIYIYVYIYNIYNQSINHFTIFLVSLLFCYQTNK